MSAKQKRETKASFAATSFMNRKSVVKQKMKGQHYQEEKWVEIPLLDKEGGHKYAKEDHDIGLILELDVVTSIADPEFNYDAMEFELKIDEEILARWHVRSNGFNKNNFRLRFPLQFKYLNQDVIDDF